MLDLAIPLGEKPGNSATFGFDLSPCGAAGITSIGTWPASTSRSLSASWRARVVRPSSTSWNSSWTATPCGGPEPQAVPNRCQISISLFLVPYSAWLARLRLILSPKLQGESGQPGLGSFRPNPIANPSKRGAFRAIFNWTRQMGVVTGRRLRCLDVPCDGCCEVRGWGGLVRVLRTPAGSHGRAVDSLPPPAQDRRPGGSAGRGLAVCRRAPGPASRRTPTQPRQERTEPPYVASVYDATSSCASIRSSSEAARSCLMVIALQ